MNEDKCLQCDWYEHYIGYCSCPNFCENNNQFKNEESEETA